MATQYQRRTFPFCLEKFTNTQQFKKIRISRSDLRLVCHEDFVQAFDSEKSIRSSQVRIAVFHGRLPGIQAAERRQRKNSEFDVRLCKQDLFPSVHTLMKTSATLTGFEPVLPP